MNPETNYLNIMLLVIKVHRHRCKALTLSQMSTETDIDEITNLFTKMFDFRDEAGTALN